MGLQLLLSVPQAEGTDAHLGCITSAVALGTTSNLSQANPGPSSQDPMNANALLETRYGPSICWRVGPPYAGGEGRWQWKGTERGNVSLPKAREKQAWTLQSWQERALLSVVSLSPWSACGGGEADLKEGQMLLKMSLGGAIL